MTPLKSKTPLQKRPVYISFTYETSWKENIDSAFLTDKRLVANMSAIK